MTRLHWLPLLAATAALLAACGDRSGQVTPPAQPRITLGTASERLVEGDSTRLTWTLSGFQSTPEVTLTSSDGAVATVAASGWVRALAPGSARIVVRAGSAADTAEVQVTQRPVTLAFVNMPDTAAAGSGETAVQARIADVRDDGVAGIALRLAPLYADAEAMTATTDVEGVAEFTLAVPTEAGEYRLEASVADPAGLAPDTATLVVTAGEAAAITIGGADPLALQVGDTARLTTSFADAFGNPAAATPVAWVSSDEDVAVVTDGLVEATGAGTASVLAMSGVLRDSVRAMVTLPPPSSATIAPAAANFTALLDTIQFSLTLTTPQGDTVTGQPISWSVLNGNVASVDVQGRVVALAPGATRVIGASGTLSDTADVSVAQVPATVLISPTGAALDAVGATAQLAAAVTDANNQPISGAGVAWSSLDPSVATVSASGLVTAQGNGNAAIVAMAGGAADTVSVTVQQEVVAVAVTPTAAAFDALGASTQLSASAMDVNGHAVGGAVVAWTSLNDVVATVDASGMVTAAANGVVQVVATYNTLADTAVITVAQVPAAVTIIAPVDTMRLEGEQQQLTASWVDANGFAIAGVATTWSSAADSIASVDAGGLVTAGAVNGSTWIWASAGAVTDSVQIAVRDVAFVLYTAANSDTVFNIQVGMFGGPPATAYIYSEAGTLLARRTGPTISYAFPAVLDGTTKRVEIKADRAQVQGIEAAEDALVGAFPAGILDLPNLAIINLAINPGLTGSLPDGLGSLTNLAALELFSTGLSGPLPASFSSLTGMDILNLSDTRLSGSVTMLESLTDLWYLNLGSTDFSGVMPELGNLTELIELRIDGSGINGYTGGLDELSAVTTIDFSDANLPAGDVDRVLADLVTSVTAVARAGTVDLGGVNAPPSPPGLAAVTQLESLGWTVIVAP
ncbi:MAG TPA: Ig-like domain-containing protein [Longimicrobiales bacterium]|nr:Ig-like domain-containing protein [Longimicrobiales bacterium]